MIIFGIYNILVSTMVIIFAIIFIKQINDDIKKDEEDKKYYDNDWMDKCIKVSKIYKTFIYIILVICILVIIATLLILTSYYTFLLWRFL